MRKPVFWIFDQVRFNLAISPSEATGSLSLEIMDIASLGIILSRKQTTKV